MTAIGLYLLIVGFLAFRQTHLPLATMVLAGVWLAIVEFLGLTFPLQVLALTWIIPGVFNFPALRRSLFTRWVFQLMRSSLPPMSSTEREALEAGSVWWDAELFSGKPDWRQLLDLPAATLSDEEQAFLNGPVEKLCAMLDDWDITHNRHDLPPNAWAFIKKHKFCGMIIPKQYGGLEFSHYAHSQVVMKLASRCVSAAVTVMVPNSLGPAKLLLAYGTEAQKQRYLPRLATGKEMPCFALTGPYAGSDAGAMPDTGVVCRGQFAGDEVLGIRLNWEKRYITLGPVATVLGLAFKLYDPDHLLGTVEDIGITLALIPTDTPGVSIGKRHYPLDSAFQNGPNWGKDVFIPLDWVIGGREQVGNGWKMLMQCLATGRSISLPALSVGGAKSVSRNSGAYARIREQFKRPIGAFEGVAEALARIAGQTYIIDAGRSITVAALEQGHRPSVLSAVVKYELTERMRQVVNDGMDIQGGSGICLGPHNYLGRFYQVIPVAITVEGANILTRCMMIFGQGAVRCHPYLQQEMAALQAGDQQAFDAAFCQHVGFVLRNFAAGVWYGFGGVRFADVPGDAHTQVYYRGVTRLSAVFAVLVDVGLLTLGGSLKRKERISGCYADALSNLYLCCCVLKHHQDQGGEADDLVLLHWACQHTLHSAQQALLGVLRLLPLRPVAWLLRAVLFPYGARYAPPGDRLLADVAALLLADNPVRERLTQGIYVNRNADDATGRIELAFGAVLAAAPAEKKLRDAQKRGALPDDPRFDLVALALEQGIVSAAEADLVRQAVAARSAAVKVDAFDAV